MTENENVALIEGETLTFEVHDPELMTQVEDSMINEKYVRGEIRIVTEQARYPLNSIAQIVEDKAYRLSPEYQRRHRWLPDRQSKLIESLIMNVPIPPIFLYEYDYSKYEVMDGLQRLTAIHDFYRDKYPLIGLTEWQELNGRIYSNLPEKIKEGIDRRYLSSVILLKETAKSEADALRLKQMVFERINSGGERLNHQETRNAIFDGPLNRLCIKLSKTGALCRLWGIPEPEQDEVDDGPPSQERVEDDAFRRMDDVELVLRFFAYRQKHKLHKGTRLFEYLDAYLRNGNFFSEKTLNSLTALFLDTIALVEAVFGEKAFWMFRRRPIDDLVELRNLISHGVIDTDNVESTDLLKERCHFVTAYGGALYDVMVQELLKYQVLLPGVKALGKPIAVYNNSIVCFETESGHIALEQVLAAATGDPMAPFRYSQIISLEVNRKRISMINITQPTKFGAKVSFKAKDSFDYFVLPA